MPCPLTYIGRSLRRSFILRGPAGTGALFFATAARLANKGDME